MTGAGAAPGGRQRILVEREHARRHRGREPLSAF